MLTLAQETIPDNWVQIATFVAIVVGFGSQIFGRGRQEGNTESENKAKLETLAVIQNGHAAELKELRGISSDLLRTVAVGAETFSNVRQDINELKEAHSDIDARLRKYETHRARMEKAVEES